MWNFGKGVIRKLDRGKNNIRMDGETMAWWIARITIIRIIVFARPEPQQVNRYWYYDSQSRFERRIYVAAHVPFRGRFRVADSRAGRDRYSKIPAGACSTLSAPLTACLSELSLCLSERLAKLTRRNHLLATATTNSSQAREPAPRSLPTTSSVNFTAVRTAL